MIPPRIQRLIDEDAANALVAERLMRGLDDWAVEAFADATVLWEQVFGWIPDSPMVRDAGAQMTEAAQSQGLSDEELVDRIERGETVGLDAGLAALERLIALHSVDILTLMCHRYWAWASAELFRLRIGSAHGYLRLQVETTALASLFGNNGQRSKQWRDIRTDEQGRRFFAETKGEVAAFLKAHDLKVVYEIGSQVGMHVRMAGVVRSLRAHPEGSLSLPDQDFDPDDPFSFHNAIDHFHRTQLRILAAIGLVLGITSAEWTERLQRFRVGCARLHKLLKVKYPEAVQSA